MSKGLNTVNAVERLAKPVARRLGLSLWDVRFRKEGRDWYLRIFIENKTSEGGTGIDDCVDFSHAISDKLDEADLIERAYILEVCSPGIERDLVRPEHFEAYVGKKVMLKTIRPVNGQREFKGILESFENPNITVRLEDGGFTFTKKEVSWIKADDFDV